MKLWGGRYAKPTDDAIHRLNASLSSAYDKDLQEDKQPVFDSFDTLQALLPVLARVLHGIRTRPERMAAVLEPSLNAVDLADYLVARRLNFRQAHEAVAAAVRLAEERGLPLDRLPLKDLQSISEQFDADSAQVFDAQVALARRNSVGGTVPQALRRRLEAARAALAQAATA